MPWVKVWIHFVWSTKNRYPFLKKIRQLVFDHIRSNARKKGIYIEAIDGYDDHVHCLVSLGADQTMSEVMRLIKGESSFWINRNRLCPVRFGWQREYFAASVSASNLDAVKRYIANQENHHRNSAFEDEFRAFLERAGFERFDDEWD